MRQIRPVIRPLHPHIRLLHPHPVRPLATTTLLRRPGQLRLKLFINVALPPVVPFPDRLRPSTALDETVRMN